MKQVVSGISLILLLTSFSALAKPSSKKHCGYLKKEHLSNGYFEISLIDSLGEWFVDLNDISNEDFNRVFDPRITRISKNGMKEVSCACVTGKTDVSQLVLSESGKVMGPLYEIEKVISLPMSRCLRDRKLPKI